MELKGAVAIVTGGGTGIGGAVCASLARAGARAVVVNYSRSAAEAEATAEEVRGLGAEAWACQADVAEDEDCRRMVAETVERYGRLDVLVNNAGTTRHIPHSELERVTDEVWDSIL